MNALAGPCPARWTWRWPWTRELYAARSRWDGQAWQVMKPPGLWDPQAWLAACAQAFAAVQPGAAVPAAQVSEQAPLGLVWVGSGQPLLADVPVQAGRLTCVNRAEALLRLADQAWHQGRAVPAERALPVYLRDKVALTTAERQALKAAP